MLKKISVFFEEHIEKIILIVVGLVCSWLLITRVLLNPNVVEYNGNNYGPGQIDEQIYNDATELKRNQTTGLDGTGPDILQGDLYASLFDDPLRDIDADLILTPNPPVGPPDGGIYAKPDIGKLTNVAFEYMRQVVYEPVIPATKQNPYENNNSEPNDLDFVTIQANYDLSKLFEEYRNVYYDNVSDEYNPDPCNTIPILASVKLERQQLNSNGSWSPWQIVPRAKNDYNRDLFKVIKSSADLPMGGLPVYKFQLKDKLTQLELLQPEPYQIATPKDVWLPPNLHQEFISAQKKDILQGRVTETATTATTTTTTTETTGRRGRSNRNTVGSGTTTGTTTRGRRGRGGNTDTALGGTNTRRSRGGTTVEQPTYDTTSLSGESELNVTQVLDDFQALVLTTDTDLSKLSEPILLWAFDDTIQPENTYRYRIQLGVLNPVAQSDNDPNLIWWSEPSDITTPVKIPDKMYFFARDVKQAARVTVSIFKLVLGYWYKDDFMVSQGEVIGDIRDVEPDDSETETILLTAAQELETIDYSTGAIMVDVTPAYRWSSTGGRSLNSKQYYDMMYSYDGEDIKHMPVTTDLRDWPEYYERWIYVQSRINQKPEPLQPWGASEIQLEQIRSGQDIGGRYSY